RVRFALLRDDRKGHPRCATRQGVQGPMLGGGLGGWGVWRARGVRMRIWLLTVEPVAGRYTEQWPRWFMDELHALKPATVGLGGYTFTDDIKHGEFLDVFGTNLYKATQLSVLVQQINAGCVKDGDWVLALDGWNPAILQLAYMRDLGPHKFKIATC